MKKKQTQTLKKDPLGYERWLLSEAEKGGNASEWMNMKLGAAILRMLIRQYDSTLTPPAAPEKPK